MENKQFYKTAVLTLLEATLVACAATSPVKPAQMENINIPSSETPIILPPHTDTLTTITTPHGLLVTPEARLTAIHGTAYAVGTQGNEGLVKKGFPEKILSSQKTIHMWWIVDYKVDDVSHQLIDRFPCNATIVNLPKENAFLIVGVGHCLSLDSEKSDATSDIQTTFPGSKIDIINTELTEFIIGELVFNRNQFGTETFLESGSPDKGFDGEGIGFVFIPKDHLSDSVRKSFEEDAITEDQLWFNAAPVDARYFGYCTPQDTDYMPVTMENGHFREQNESALLVEPYLEGGGCSGSGIFFTNKLEDEKLYLVSILGGHWIDDPEKPTAIITYKLEGIGKEGFYNYIAKAKADYENHK